MPSSNSLGTASRRTCANRSVYVVEDDAMVRRMMVVALRKDGWEVSAFSDGSDVILAATGGAPDVVVTDLVMPGLSGDELVAWMRRRPATAMVPVVVVTAVHPDDRRLAALTADPAVSVMRKPFGIADFLRRVGRSTS